MSSLRRATVQLSLLAVFIQPRKPDTKVACSCVRGEDLTLLAMTLGKGAVISLKVILCTFVPFYSVPERSKSTV